MKDFEFKNFDHQLPGTWKINSHGSNIDQTGNYRPDISIVNRRGRVCTVMESESKSDRKAFIGSIVHAAKFATDTQSKISLIIVMKESGNQTTVDQVTNNVRPYYRWLKKLGTKHLTEVLFISDTAYINSQTAEEVILSNHFRVRCTKL